MVNEAPSNFIIFMRLQNCLGDFSFPTVQERVGQGTTLTAERRQKSSN